MPQITLMNPHFNWEHHCRISPEMGGPFDERPKGPLPHWSRLGYELAGTLQSAGDSGEYIANLRA
jgi:hypothetical protein